MLESSVLTGGIFTVVVVSDNHSFNAVIAVVGADLGRDAESEERDKGRCRKQAYEQDLRSRGAGEDRDIWRRPFSANSCVGQVPRQLVFFLDPERVHHPISPVIWFVTLFYE